MPTFADVVDAVDKLSADEQESLLRILRRRIIAQVAGDVAEARAESVRGAARLIDSSWLPTFRSSDRACRPSPCEPARVAAT